MTRDEHFLIIGAGVFGLSTALAVARRKPQAVVTIVDRVMPPVLDGASVDTTRCIRAGNLILSLLQDVLALTTTLRL